MKESYSDEMGKRVGLNEYIKKSNLQAADSHLESQEDEFQWKSRVLEDLFEVVNKDSSKRVTAAYDLILNMARNHIKTYNKQIEEQENEINEDTPKVIKDVLISSVNVLKEQRTFYNKISEQFYNLSEEETQSQKALSSLIRTMQKDVVSKYETSRKNDPIAVQIDNEIVVGPTDDTKYLHLN